MLTARGRLYWSLTQPMTRKLRLRNLFPSVRRSFRLILLFGSAWPQADCRLPRNTKGGGLRPSRASLKCDLCSGPLCRIHSPTRDAIEDGQPILFALGMRSRLCTSRATLRSSNPQRQDSGPSLQVEGALCSGDQEARLLSRQTDAEPNTAIGRRSHGGVRKGEGLDPREH